MSGASDISRFGKPLGRDNTEKVMRDLALRKGIRMVVLIGLILATVGFYLLHSFYKSADREMTTAYLKAVSVYEKELEAFSEKLQNTEDLSKVADLRPDHSKSATLFLEFAKAYPDEAMGWDAALRVAQHQIRESQVEEALGLLDPLVRKTRRFPIFQVKVRRTLAGLYAEKGEFGKAFQELDVIEKVKESPIREESLLFKGQLLYLSGDQKGAGELLSKLADGGQVGDVIVSQEIAADAALWLNYWNLN